MNKQHVTPTRLLLLVALSMYACQSVAQVCPFAGKVLDATTGLAVDHAVVFLVERGWKAETDREGRFQFAAVLPGTYTMSIRHVAFSAVDRIIMFNGSPADTAVILLQPALYPSDEVEVRSARAQIASADAPYPTVIRLEDQLADGSHVGVSDALKDAPGLALVSDGAWETGVSIRGMSRSNIVTLVDDTRIETANDILGALSLINMHDLERVEAMKTSGSILYGTGALGGIVHLITKRASFADHPQVSGEWATDLSSVDGRVGSYLALDQSSPGFAVRFSGGYRKAGNTATPEGEIPNSGFHDFSLAGSLASRVAGDQSLRLTYQRSQADNAGIPGGAPFASGASATYRLARRELFAAEYDIPHLFPALPTLTVRVARQEIDRDVSVVQSPVVTLTPHATHVTMSAQVESRLVPAPDVLLTVGAEAWQRNLDSQRERHLLAVDQTVGERPLPRASYFSSGVYAQGEWVAVPSVLQVMTGIRFDRIHVANDETWNPQYVISGGVLQVPPPDRQLLWPRATADNGSWGADAGLHAGLGKQWDATLLLTTAFRSPSLEERYQYLDLGSVVYLGDPELRPEQSVCLNAGIRAHSERWSMQVDAFVNTLKDLVTQVPSTYEGRAAYVSANIGSARLYGFEVSGEQAITPWGAVRGSASYARGEDRRAHTNLPQIAPFNGTVELVGYGRAAGRLTVSCSWASRQSDPGPGEPSTPGYAVAGVAAESHPINIGGALVTFRAAVENLMNREYRNHLSTLRGIVTAEPGRDFSLSLDATL